MGVRHEGEGGDPRSAVRALPYGSWGLVAACLTFGQEEPQEAREPHHSYTGVELRGRVAQILVYIWREREKGEE